MNTTDARSINQEITQTSLAIPGLPFVAGFVFLRLFTLFLVKPPLDLPVASPRAGSVIVGNRGKLILRRGHNDRNIYQELQLPIICRSNISPSGSAVESASRKVEQTKDYDAT